MSKIQKGSFPLFNPPPSNSTDKIIVPPPQADAQLGSMVQVSS